MRGNLEAKTQSYRQPKEGVPVPIGGSSESLEATAKTAVLKAPEYEREIFDSPEAGFEAVGREFEDWLAANGVTLKQHEQNDPRSWKISGPGVFIQDALFALKKAYKEGSRNFDTVFDRFVDIVGEVKINLRHKSKQDNASEQEQAEWRLRVLRVLDKSRARGELSEQDITNLRGVLRADALGVKKDSLKQIETQSRLLTACDGLIKALRPEIAQWKVAQLELKDVPPKEELQVLQEYHRELLRKIERSQDSKVIRQALHTMEQLNARIARLKDELSALDDQDKSLENRDTERRVLN